MMTEGGMEWDVMFTATPLVITHSPDLGSWDMFEELKFAAKRDHPSHLALYDLKEIIRIHINPRCDD